MWGLLSPPWRRLTCHGDSCNSRSESSPPRHFLVRAGHWCHCDGVTNIVLGFSLKLLRDRRGNGEESKRKRSVSVVKGWIDRKRSNKKQMERENKISTHKWRKPSSSFLLVDNGKCIQWEWRLSQHDLSFIPSPFEGRLNPKTSLRPFFSHSLPSCGPRPR